MKDLTIDVHGVPGPQGSKRHVGRGRMVESSRRVKPWRAAVSAACDGFPVIDRPVEVEAWFYFARPKGHYRTGKHAAQLRDSAAPYPHLRTQGDLDKLARATLDGLTHTPARGDLPASPGVLADDSLVVDLVAHKRWADVRPPGAIITIRPR